MACNTIDQKDTRKGVLKDISPFPVISSDDGKVCSRNSACSKIGAFLESLLGSAMLELGAPYFKEWEQGCF